MRRREWAAFAVLCVWAASAWLLEPLPAEPPALIRQGVGFAVVALLAALAGVWKRTGHRALRGGWRLRGGVVLASVLFFAAPAVLLDLAREDASETSVTIVFALAPVVVVLVWGAVSSGARSMRVLVPALAGVAGLLLLLPFKWPASLHGWESLAEALVAMLLVACAGVWMHRLLEGVNLLDSLAYAGAVNAIALLVWCWARGGFAWWWSSWTIGVWIDMAAGVVEVALTMWLLRVTEPVRFSARFLVIPLVTVVEGLAFVRPGLSARLVVGMTLLTAGAVWMLVAKEAVEDEVLTLR